jgi:polyphosphate kinase 2 (PPK2 family)
VLEKIDLGLSLERDEYNRRLKELKNRIGPLGFEVYRRQKPVIILLEGPDASGKGGAIKRFTDPLDPRGFVVWPIGPPHGDDRERHYLFRFWKRVPEKGQIAIFDRSWYGRVLVERVEGFCSEDDWKRAYAEINQFERLLVDNSTIIIKFYIHFSKKEQLSRFRGRQNTSYKSWKLTDEDWRNRGKWEDYLGAAQDMLLKTSTYRAPWVIVEGEDKLHARIRILESIVERLEKEL